MADVIGGSIVWDLNVKDDKYKAGLDNAKSQAQQAGKDIEGSFQSMANGVVNALNNAASASLTFAGTLAGIVGVIGFGVKMAGDIETVRQGFVTLLGSAEAADEAIAMIKRDAAATPFDFAGLARANQMLTSVTKNAPQSERLLLNVGKALAAAGKGSEELDRIIVNLQQIANTGHITELDIRQFGFAGINILELLAEHYGVTKDQANEMVKSSSNAFADLEAAFIKAGEGSGRFSRAFIEQAGTWNQLVARAGDVVGQLFADVTVGTGIFDSVKSAFSGLIDSLEAAKPSIIEAVKGFMTFMRDNAGLVAGIIIGGLVPAFWALGASLAPLVPFVLIGAAIGFAIDAIVKAFGGWDAIMQKINPALQFLGNIFNTYIKPALDILWQTISTQLLPELQKLWDLISPVLIPVLKILAVIVGATLFAAVMVFIGVLILLTQFISDLVKVVNGSINKIVQYFNNLVEGVKAVWELINTEVSQWPGKLFNWGKKMIQSFADGIKSAGKFVVDAVGNVLNAAKKLLEGNSPPIAGPFKEIDKWGINVGSAWVEGLQSAINSVSFNVSGSSLSGGSSDFQASSGRSTTITHAPVINITLGTFIGTEAEKRRLAKELEDSLNQYYKGRGQA